ncbi:putative cytokinetic ring protein SteA [Nocardioides yefusunii]|uniref:Cytokinetic ring protein SteA n=1 Tax=Nocardioides yefusunii TaxID=2500546 RepID=A0ABW1R0H2_9ACTN|nr:putative cytokinetic ring protein SteA [Nocardioides yefusunii]
MKFSTRSRAQAGVAGVTGPARVDRGHRAELPGLREGEIAVIDRLDLDRDTAHRLLDAGVVAVLNASATVSGRFPTQGAQVLVDAGVVVVDQVGPELVTQVSTGDVLTVDADQVQVGRGRTLTGRRLDQETVAALLQESREGLTHQLESFTHNSAEFLRREQDVLLDGGGVPTLATRVAGRPVVVFVPGNDLETHLKQTRRFLAEQKPVVIAVDTALETLRKRRVRSDVVVLSGSHAAGDRVSPKALRSARDVVVRADRGASAQIAELLAQRGIRASTFESSATTDDVALLLADASGASVIVGAGLHATLSDFLDRQRSGIASTYLTRLKVGARLVDVSALATLYSGRVRPRHLLALVAAGAIALGAAVATTPVGQEWADDLGDSSSQFIDTIQGKFQ